MSDNVPPQDETVELLGRGAELVLRDTAVEIRLPYLFGERVVSVSVESLGVNDPTAEVVRHERASPELVQRTPIRIIPPALFPLRLMTANLCLMFKAPIDLPRPRLAAAWLLDRRRRRGVYGLFVTARDPAAAAYTLSRWGADRVNDPTVWIARHWADSESEEHHDLQAPAFYLSRMGRLWLALVALFAVGIIGWFAVGLGPPALLVAAVPMYVLRTRWDHLLRDYRAAMWSEGLQPLPTRGWSLVGDALAHAVDPERPARSRVE